MRQIAQYQDGRIELQEVPVPTAPPGGILVRTTHSVISVGTEKMKVEQAKMNLLQKAMARPDQVRKVLETARTLGWQSALEKVRNRLSSPTPLGYSAAGVVIGVDAGNTRFRVGDRVAIGGAECAFHSEIVAIPDRLASPVPVGVELADAAYATLASIAMQGLRQSQLDLGSRALVIGQGLIGLLTTSLARCAGLRIAAMDLAPGRLELSRALGAELVFSPKSGSPRDLIREWTGGQGVDAVFLCIASRDNSPAELAASVLRDRGTLVIVGNANVQLDWKSYYEKELRVVYSRSYGPGRYDPEYEWGGHDYPIGHVRWTEQRNMEACLELMHDNRMQLDRITTRRVPFDGVLGVYKELQEGSSQDVGVVVEYPEPDPAPRAQAPVPSAESSTRASAPVPTPGAALDMIGAGNFARTMLLPHLRGKVPFDCVANNTALSARHVAKEFGFGRSETNASAVIAAREGAPVVIATRHHLHAPLVGLGLQHNRHVFVEKPLCLTREELAQLDELYQRSAGSVMVGFNRRYSAVALAMRKVIAAAPGPISISCRVNAGLLAPGHWYANLAESGGRILGEACHFLDLFRFLTGSEATSVSALPAWPMKGVIDFPDSVAAQIGFANGSVAQLIYSGEGNPSYPKESVTVMGAGFVLACENFMRLTIYQGRKVRQERSKSKGHAEEIAAWVRFLNGQTPHPQDYEDARRSMLLTFAVLESLHAHEIVRPAT